MKQTLYLFLLVLFVACKQEPQIQIPQRPVNIIIKDEGILVHFFSGTWGDYVTADEQGLHYHGQTIYRQEGTGAFGYGGIVTIVTNNNNNPYASFDLACPNCYEKKAQPVRIKVEGIFATCPECGEQYNIGTGVGSPDKGISHYNLQRYTTTRNSGSIHVTN